MGKPRRVVIVGFDDAELLDVTGPASVFATATRLLGPGQRGYRVEMAAPGGGSFTAFGGVTITANHALADLRGPIDTLLVAGGDPGGAALNDQQLADGIRRAARHARRVVSVCTGAFLLANAGLLDGRRATTHWYACEALRARHPSVRVEEDPIFIQDGAVWTAAGVTSGIDLCLALVDEDHGRPLALAVSRWLVLYLRRSGGQSQFSVQMLAQCAERQPLRELQSWIAEHVDGDLEVETLARRVHMSPRNFARVFRREVGSTPGNYVEAARLEAARRALETTSHTIKRIAADAGFGARETLHRVFHRRYGVTPDEYRRRFGAADRGE